MRKFVFRMYSFRPRLPILLAICLLFLFGLTYGQSADNVSGTVTSSSGGQPVVGASVSVKSTKIGTSTDASGNFTLKAGNKSVLVVSNVGFKTQEIAVNDQKNFSIAMEVVTSNLDEVVVVGYGRQKKLTVTGAVTAVKGTELEKSPAVNLSNSLSGRLPGITAIQSSGEPGYDGSTIRIRGSNTIGNSSALIVIDGVPDRAGGFDRLNPADIESMSVLKDASAAIYGSRAANGVILITTKQGKSGKPVITYDFNQGWAQPTRIPGLADAVEYTELLNEQTLFGSVPANQWSEHGQHLKTPVLIPGQITM